MTEELTEAQWKALMTIVDRGEEAGDRPARNGTRPRPRAWFYARDLAAMGHDAADVDALIAESWLDAWDRSDGRAVTLSTWAAERLAAEIAEHWEPGREEEERKGPDGRPLVRRGLSEEPHWIVRLPELDVDGRPLKARRRPVRIPQHRGMVSLSDTIRDIPSRDKGPLDRMIEDEDEGRYATQVAVKDDGRLDVDEETGKVKRVPIRVLPRYARDEGKMKIDHRLVRRRPGPKRARADQ